MGSNIVVFNALQTSLSGGIGRYSYELAKAIYLKNKVNLKIVIRTEDKDLFKFAKNQDLIIVENINNSIDRNKYEQFMLPKRVYKEYPNAVVHYPDSMAPLLCKNKVVITVHDLAFKSLKNVFTKKTVLWKNTSTKFSMKKASEIIAITKFTEEEIRKHYPEVNKDKISVILNGFNKFSQDKINLDKINKSILKLKDKDYVLTVSTISPRKNVDGLINAFNTIKDEVSYDLVIAGSNGWMYESVHQQVKDLNLQDRVHFTGKINDDELKYLYKNSKVFVYPSFYEGFGLPPLEAMSYKVPCVVSNRTSIPEVVGDSAITVDPSDYTAMGKEIKKLIFDKELREFYINKGINRLNEFSWEKCAEETIVVYKKILDK